MSRNLQNEIVSFDIDSYIVDEGDYGSYIETNRDCCESGSFVYSEEYDKLLDLYKSLLSSKTSARD